MNKVLNKKYITWVIVGIAIVVGYNFYSNTSKVPGELDSFASCLKDNGAKLYGATWCPHCTNQKELFGNSAKNLPYVECALPNSQAINPLCTNEKIEGYPTWTFADGSRESGVQSVEKLAAKTSCALPVINKLD